MRNIILGTLAFSLVACAGEGSPDSTAGPTQAEAPVKLDAAAIHAKTLTLDTHIDIPLTYMTEIDPTGETELQVDLPKLNAGELDSGFGLFSRRRVTSRQRAMRKAARLLRRAMRRFKTS